MSISKINSYAKINLSLGVLGKLKNKLHRIESLVSFKRAGASAVVTYFAEEVAKKLR